MARILVIEDNPENLYLMSYLLEAAGHKALLATDGETGVELARREAPDLIVCDIHLPVTDGYEVARRLKRDPALGAIPLVAVTAMAMVGDRDKVLAAGFDAYLAKPIVPKRFAEQVANYLPKTAASLAASVWRHRDAEVLVVDDSPLNRELIRQTLTPAGYALRLTGSVAEGLAAAHARAPDLILSDLHMPGESGFAFIRQAKAEPRLAQVPFIIVTSSIWADADRVTARQLGAVRFLTRPIAPRALLEEIAACLPPQGDAHGHDPDRR